jgi:pimeloyl-ACP methyl ester carboxylesterase
VHGAWADASSFAGVIRALQDRGFRAIGFANPLRGLAEDARYLADLLRTLAGPLVRVGHSYGGAVISAAATANEQVKSLVFFNGWMPDEGESIAQIFEKSEGSLAGPAITPMPFTGPDGSEGGQDLYLDPERFHAVFAADVDRGTADVMAATQRPWSGAGFYAPSGPPAWKTLPCWYLLCSDRRRRPSGSWPSVRTRGSRRWRPPTPRWCRSPRPRHSSSFRPLRPRRPQQADSSARRPRLQ